MIRTVCCLSLLRRVLCPLPKHSGAVQLRQAVEMECKVRLQAKHRTNATPKQVSSSRKLRFTWLCLINVIFFVVALLLLCLCDWNALVLS